MSARPVESVKLNEELTRLISAFTDDQATGFAAQVYLEAGSAGTRR